MKQTTDNRASPNQIRLMIIVMQYSLGQSWLLVVIISDL